MARGIEDLELLSAALGVIERPLPPVPAARLRIGLYRTPHWQDAEPANRDALEATAKRLADEHAIVEPVDDPEGFDGLTEMQDRIMHWEGRGAYLSEYLNALDILHPAFRDEVENSSGRTRSDIIEAYDHVDLTRRRLEQAFFGFDAWLTPATPGEAPEGLESSGLATFNRMWTALHGPCITIPADRGPGGLPVGVQLVAPRLHDAGLLAVARTVAAVLKTETVAPVMTV